MDRQKVKTYDAIVVGSGASGGWVAKILCEKGAEVLMLEAGPPRVPARDFTEHAWSYRVRFRGFGDTKTLLERQPVQRFTCNEYNRHFFVDDKEHPYTFEPEKPFQWIRGRQVGGKTFMWARCSYRFSDLEFQAASRDGYGENWPIAYRDLEPYYDLVESYIGVSGSREGLEQFPDGRFLPPMRLSCGEVYARSIIDKEFGWRLVPDRRANLTAPLNGRPACHYCGECNRGCFTASYFNSPAVTLPAAARTGRYTLVSDAVVSHLAMDDRGKASGVVFLDRNTRAEREVRGRVVVLAASALESTRILLNSRSRRFPLGVGGSSGALGHYLMDHFTVESASGVIPSMQSSRRDPVGRPGNFIIPKYTNADSHFPDKRFLRGFYLAGASGQGLYNHAFGMRGFGQELRRRVREEIPYNFTIYGQGETLPRYENYVSLDPDVKDAWGIPALRFRVGYSENEHAMARAIGEKLGEIVAALKLQDRSPISSDLSVFGKNIHETGTARMGNDPRKSVVNRFNQVHDAPNVFVTDGSSFVTVSCYEPTLTIMAISARAADYIANEYLRKQA
jgi:choline dehydrogenase-like flavoprotein